MTFLRDRANRFIVIWPMLLMIALIALGAMTVAYLSQRESATASHKAARTAQCVNHLLGDRADITARDSLSQIAFADLAAIGFTKSAPTDEQAKVINKAWGLGVEAGVMPTSEQFLRGLSLHAKTLTEDQKAKDAKPLGRC